MPNISKPASADLALRIGSVTATFCAAFVTALCLVGAWPVSATLAGRTHTVLIEGMQFSPPTIRIQPGDTIVFKNRDLVPHTATAKQRDGFDSGIINPGESWVLVPPVHAAVPYVCTFHPMMQGRIEVAGP